MRTVYAVATLPYPPSANRYWRSWRGRVVVSKEAREYKAAVAAILRHRIPEDGPVALEIEVTRPARRGDLDNTLKVLLDACKGREGSLFLDDSQVVELHAWRMDRRGKGEVLVRAYKVRASNDVG